MADSLFNGNIQTIITQLTSDIPSATSDELLIFGRMIKSIKQTENANLESLLNSRVSTLLAAATTIEEVSTLSNAVGKVIDIITPDTTTGKELPEQDGHADKFLTTNGTNMSWDTLELSDFKDIDHPTLTTNDFLVYDSTSSKYKGETSIPSNILTESYSTQSNLPSSGVGLGNFAITTDTSTIYYHTGSEWKEFGTF